MECTALHYNAVRIVLTRAYNKERKRRAGESNELRERLMVDTRVFRKGTEEAGFRIIPGVHPIVPVGRSRIRVQVSAARTVEQIEIALEKFTKVGKLLGAI
jgi:7-keto-8-aminopelargonate synthetase-like enzyme